MLDDFKKEQKVAYTILKNAINKNKYSHAYLFETNGYYAKNEFVKSFVKQLLCPYNFDKCQNCEQCFQIDNNIFADVENIYPDGMWIKKEQLDKLQKDFSTKSINGNKRVYIIHETEKMNVQAANSILKFLEEPEENIIAILMTDNIYQLLDTIVSRCQLITLSKNRLCIQETFLDKIKYNISLLSEMNITDEEILQYVNNAIMFVQEYEKNGKDILLSMQKKYISLLKEKKDIILFFEIIILYYFDAMHCKCNINIEIFNDRQNELENIGQNNTVEQLNNKINIFIKYKKLIKFNVNINLLFDKLIFDLERSCEQ